MTLEPALLRRVWSNRQLRQRLADDEADSGGSGGSPKWQLLSGPVTGIASDAFVLLPWGVLAGGGDDLLDLADPQNPAVKVTGLYTVCVSVACFQAVAGKAAFIELDIDAASDFSPASVVATFSIAGAVALGTADQCSLTVALPLAAGATLTLGVRHAVGSPVNFSLSGGSIVCA